MWQLNEEFGTVTFWTGYCLHWLDTCWSHVLGKHKSKILCLCNAFQIMNSLYSCEQRKSVSYYNYLYPYYNDWEIYKTNSLQIIVFFGFPHQTVGEMSCPFEDSSASIFNVPQLIQGGTQMVQRKQSVGYTEWFGEIWSNTATQVGKGNSCTTAQTPSDQHFLSCQGSIYLN
jgi:hypothetical protein